jgi:hypothetical protein
MKITESKEEDTKSSRGTDKFFVPRINELLHLRTFVPSHAELNLSVSHLQCVYMYLNVAASLLP